MKNIKKALSLLLTLMLVLGAVSAGGVSASALHYTESVNLPEGAEGKYYSYTLDFYNFPSGESYHFNSVENSTLKSDSGLQITEGGNGITISGIPKYEYSGVIKVNCKTGVLGTNTLEIIMRLEIVPALKIGSYSELQAFAARVNAGETDLSVRLTNDIDASESDPESFDYDAETTAWTPIGNYNKKFTGSFDGDGHVITGLTFNDSPTDYAGLFGYIQGIKEGDITVGGIVKNVCLEGGSISGGNYAGGIAGCISGGAVINCGYSGSVSGDYRVGGVAGDNNKGTVSNCYNTGDVSGCFYAGGVAGNNAGSIINCYNTGSVTATGTNAFAGGVVGYNKGSDSSVETCYSTGDVTVTENGTDVYAGGIAGINYGNGSLANCYYEDKNNLSAVGNETVDTVAVLTSTEMIAGTYTGGEVTNMPGFSSDAWLVRESDLFASYYPHLKGFEYDNTGVVADWPARIMKDGEYELETYAQLKDFASVVNSGNTSACAKLKNDIECKNDPEDVEYAADWAPVGIDYEHPYTGTFDGVGHIITGLTFNDTSVDYAGLFGYVGPGGTVKNIGLEDGNITGEDFVGGVAGYIDGGTVANCYNTCSVTATGNYDYVGGVAGRNDGGTVKNCYNIGNVTATGNNTAAGGIIGRNDNSGTVKNCYSTGAVTATGNNSTVGGVAGYSGYRSSITNCYYDKSVCGDIGAVNGRDIASKNSAGLDTANMTGINAVSTDNMAFDETDPWLLKENTCLIDFYPHLTGFNLDKGGAQIPAENIDIENWPPLAEPGTGEHKYGDTGDDRFTCAVCGQVDDELKAAVLLSDYKESVKAELDEYKNPDDYRAEQKNELSDAIIAGKNNIDNAENTSAVDDALADAKAAIDAIKTDAQLTAEEQAAAEQLAEDKAAFDEYKQEQKDAAADLAKEGDSEECAALIKAAQDAIDELTYDESKSLDENKAAVDEKANLTQLAEDLEEQRAAEKLAEDKAAFDEYKQAQKEAAAELAEEGDSEECAALIKAAQYAIDELTYDESKPLDENKAAVDEKANLTQLAEDLEEQRGADAAAADSDVYPEADLCPLDSENHGDSFWGKIVKFIHTIIWRIFKLFGINLFVKVN